MEERCVLADPLSGRIPANDGLLWRDPLLQRLWIRNATGILKSRFGLKFDDVSTALDTKVLHTVATLTRGPDEASDPVFQRLLLGNVVRLILLDPICMLRGGGGDPP